MKSYIRGYYAPSDRLLRTLATPKKRKTLNTLLNSYPASMMVKEIASKGKVNYKTVYQYLPQLEQDGFIRKVEEPEEKGGQNRYVIENVNSLARYRYNYSLAPGNVEYSNEFNNALKRLVNQLDIESYSMSILGFAKDIVRRTDVSDDTDIRDIAPSKNATCSECGLNHEARDFIRSILLYLLDEFEGSLGYLEFLRDQNYVDKVHYEEYYKVIQEKVPRRKSETEQHRTKKDISLEMLHLRIISIGRANGWGYISCLAINQEGGLIPLAVHKSLVTNVFMVDTVIGCMPSAVLNNTVFLAMDNPHFQVLSDAEYLPKLTSIPIMKLENILPRPGGMEIISGIIEANVDEQYEEPGPQQSRLLISDETGEAGLAFKASFDCQIELVHNYPGRDLPWIIDWPLHVNDHIRIVGGTSVYDRFYEGPRLTIELQPYSSLYVLKNGTFEQLEYEWAQ